MNAWTHVERLAGYHNRTSDAETALRFERGGRVFASDGPVGTLDHVVIDDQLSNVKWLVVTIAGGLESVLVPVDLAVSTAGSAVFLGVTQAQFAVGASQSPRYDDARFSATSLRKIRQQIGSSITAGRRRAIGAAGTDWVTTQPLGIAPTRMPEIQPVETRSRGLFRRTA